jgi:hypothetical protein
VNSTRERSDVSEERSLTDADTEALAAALEARIVKRFYLNIGMGVWGLAWKGVVILLVLLAAYGAARGHFS